jgi:hypothetical protein
MRFVTPKNFARTLAWLLLVSLPATGLHAADAPATAAAPVLLWPQGAPNAAGQADSDQPAIYPFLPSVSDNTGAGVLLVPSAPFSDHNPDREAIPTAQWLNAHGIAAFALRYRGALGYPSTASVADVNRALQYLHAHAADFHLSAKRIGVLGFAAGAVLAADAAFAPPPETNSAATDLVARASNHPDFLALIYGASLPAAPAAFPPPTFLVGSTRASDQLTTMIDLWTYLRSPQLRVPVEAHFFPKVDTTAGLASGDPTLGVWPDLFYNWVRAYGFLTDQPRVAIHGTVSLDGRPLPFGYLILTPLDAIGAGPIIAHVFNSTQGVAIGSFSVPAKQGPVPGRYRVDVRQNANRWLSNAFSNDLIRDPAFGHSRILSPSIDDQHSYTKVHPGDKDDIIVDIKPDGNPDLDIAVFSQ